MKHIYSAVSGIFLAAIISFIHSSASAQSPNWTLSLSFTNGACFAIASSYNGTNLVVGGNPQAIYTSTDSGADWNSTGFGASHPLPVASQFLSGGHPIAMSADGTRIAFVSGNTVYCSTDSGATWNPFTGAQWTGVASSSDGLKLAASSRSSGVYVSSNGGTNWTQSSSTVQFIDIASSGDGMKLLAAPWNGGDTIYTSADGGYNWTPHLAGQNWISVASSTNGATLVAASQNDSAWGNQYGQIYVSTNSGNNWTAVGSPALLWESVSCSADGQIIAAAAKNQGAYPGQIYISTDTGTSWQLANAPVQIWESIAVSGDGREVAAAAISTNGVYPGVVYTAALPALSGPVVNLLAGGGNAYVQWPNPSSGYVLQQSPDLTNWVAVTNPPAVINQVVLPATGSNAFFRLVRP
jgi:hypothetical protein